MEGVETTVVRSTGEKTNVKLRCFLVLLKIQNGTTTAYPKKSKSEVNSRSLKFLVIYSLLTLPLSVLFSLYS
jgi:hypothetical protein